MSRRNRHQTTENNQKFLNGPGGRGACSDTDRKTIKKVTTKRRRSDDLDHIEEQQFEDGQKSGVLVMPLCERDVEVGTVITLDRVMGFSGRYIVKAIRSNGRLVLEKES